MKPEATAKLKYGVWGLVFGAAAAMIVGFAWGGWVTGGTAKGRSDEAVLASRAAICVAQFMRAPNHAQEIKAFEQTDLWKRSELIEKGGGIRCPGRQRPAVLWPKHAPRGFRLLPQNEPAVQLDEIKRSYLLVLAVGLTGRSIGWPVLLRRGNAAALT